MSLLILVFFWRNKLKDNGIAIMQLNIDDKNAWIKVIYIILILYLLLKKLIKFNESRFIFDIIPIIGKKIIKQNMLNTK